MKVAVSRSPLSGAVLEVDIDVEGLDPPWWDARAPMEASDELPEEVVSFTGAMRLDLDRLGSAPFLAVPGPEVPFVHPLLLGVDRVVAVVSQLQVGPHTGYPIVYYAPPGTDVPMRLNRWGSNSYRYAGGVEGADHPYEGDWDYDLRPWVERGKLQWIAPGDGSFTLRTGVDGCPYLELVGRRAIARVQEGEAWWPDDVD